MLNLVGLSCNPCSAMSFKSILADLPISNSKIYVGIYCPKMAICPTGTVVLKDTINELCCKFLLYTLGLFLKKGTKQGIREGELGFCGSCFVNVNKFFSTWCWTDTFLYKVKYQNFL